MEKKQDIPPRNPAVYGRRSDPTLTLSDVEFKSHFSSLYLCFYIESFGLSLSVPSGASCVVGPDLHVYLSFCLQNIESGS